LDLLVLLLSQSGHMAANDDFLKERLR